MKKQKINSLKLNKKTVSNLDPIKGGRLGIGGAGIITMEVNLICRSARGHCENSFVEGCECSIHVCDGD